MKSFEQFAGVPSLVGASSPSRSDRARADNQGNWLQTGVHDALVEPDDHAPELAAVCVQLARDPEPAVRRGAAEILT
ncbi:hypothetical protein AB0D54_22385 [Streptomyces xanthophaeus]|uniref:hypothetical protein n=1 Tax=Streptomyces xanthophaeus TaxID=67385 RepID=UPI0034317308